MNINCRYGTITVLLAFSTVAVGSDGSSVVSQWCQCLSEPPAQYDGARDGSPVVSVIVPMQFTRSEPNKCDSHEITWTSAGVLSLGVNSKTSDLISGPNFGALGPNECVAYINQARVLVNYSFVAGSTSLSARIETIKHGENYVSFSATAESPDTLCDLGGKFLWSAVLVNDWQSLKVRLIAGDRLSFAYTNEIGEIRAAKVGQIISRNFGRVAAINETSVILVELVSNGLGGYNEVERKIPFVAL
jgi:hypothetical protein